MVKSRLRLSNRTSLFVSNPIWIRCIRLAQICRIFSFNVLHAWVVSNYIDLILAAQQLW